MFNAGDSVVLVSEDKWTRKAGLEINDEFVVREVVSGNMNYWSEEDRELGVTHEIRLIGPKIVGSKDGWSFNAGSFDLASNMKDGKPRPKRGYGFDYS